MTVPALPATQSTGGTATASYANSIRALLAFFRDDVPVLKVQNNGAQSINDATETDVDFSGTPLINVGGWTNSPTTYDGWNVPETGVYEIITFGSFASDTDGYRYIVPTDEGTNIVGARLDTGSAGSASTTGVVAVTYHYFTAGDELGANAYHTAGAAINLNAYLMARWLCSSTS